MIEDNFKKDLLNKESIDIFFDYLQGNDVWYFSSYLEVKNPSQTYDSFKKFVAKSLNVSFNNISIVGSGKLGFSLSPDKNFRTFQEKDSDIDLVIVSKDYYNLFWKAYLDLYDQKMVVYQM